MPNLTLKILKIQYIMTKVIKMNTVLSTNDEVRAQLDNLDNLTIISAEKQLAGRGQRGNSWTSERGQNLTFSLLLRYNEDGYPYIDSLEPWVLSEITAVSVQAALNAHGIIAKIKWPNDVYVRGKKIAGILIENLFDEDKMSSSIVGVGLNVNQKEFPPQLINPTSMALETNLEFSPEKVLDDFFDYFEFLLLKVRDEGRSEVDKFYHSMLYRRGQWCEFVDCASSESFEGCIDGVTPQGRLIISDKDGRRRDFGFKEVNFIL